MNVAFNASILDKWLEYQVFVTKHSLKRVLPGSESISTVSIKILSLRVKIDFDLIAMKGN